MINRTEAPSFKSIDEFPLIHATRQYLDNGIPMYSVSAGDQEIVRVELLFRNINWDSAFPLQAYASNSLITEGAKNLTSFQIAERVDYYGAFIQTDFNYDYSVITVYSLTKHLPEILPILRAVVTEAEFPDMEISTFKNNQKQKLMVSLMRNDFVCRRIFNKTLFGENQYGSVIDSGDYDLLNRDQLMDYYEKAYQPANCTIVLSGKIGESESKLINHYFGKDWTIKAIGSVNKFEFEKRKGILDYIEKPDALQSAIRLGNITINRTHPDFSGLQVLNTVLGGYFGSRLMSNIREDKGYTYGIGSALVSLQDAGYFFIASEVGVDVCQATLDEIEKEINIIKNDLISDHELETVKNYILGSFLGSLENAFSHADKFKSLLYSGLDYSYYSQFVSTVKRISSEDLRLLANKYFDFGQFNKVIVGKR